MPSMASSPPRVFVEGNSVQPSAQGCASVEFLGGEACSNQRLLHQILRIFSAAGELEDEAVEPVVKAVNQFRLRGGVPICHSMCEL